MRKLILLRGLMGAGKSTFIEENGLAPYTLNADVVRLQFQSPMLDIEGRYSLSQENNKEVWHYVNGLVEKKMQNGEFIVIDATHLKESDMRAYKDISEKYRYKVYAVDFTDIPLEELIRRNELREPYMRHKVETIHYAAERLRENSVPKFIELISREEAKNIINLKPIDFSHYNKIHHIGDIHGCYTVLMEYLNGRLKEDELYIFCGDFIDRGLENFEVVDFMIKIMNKPNVIIIEGNHDKYLNMYAKNEPAYSKVFENETKQQLEGRIDKKDLRRFHRRFINVAYYTYHGKTVMVTHGGLPFIPENLNFISSEQLIKGIGNYDTDIDRIFTENNKENELYQIHGHRNFQNSEFAKYSKSFSLENSVEYGGYLRVLTLTKDNMEFIEVKNNIYKLPDSLKIDTDVDSLINILRDSRDIKEKKFENISSFNFSRDVFYKKYWDFKTVKARGLFINTKTKKIVARGYEKFFNVDERPETELKSLRNNLVWPAFGYVKENGYLGMIGYDEENDDFIFASKSTIVGDFPSWLKELFLSKITKDNQVKLLKKLKDNNLTLTFEVIDYINDPHIIKYFEKRLVLLDVIKRVPKFEKLSYNELVDFANEFGFECKKIGKIINNLEEFNEWYKEISSEDYKYLEEDIEGFVIEDSTGFMFKVKLDYYRRWKYLRTLKDNLNKVDAAVLDKESLNFLNWVKTLNDEERAKDIIHLRERWLKI